MKRILIYAALGLLLGYLTGEGIKLLPRPWAAPVIFGLLCLILGWAIRSLVQIRRAQRRLRELQRLVQETFARLEKSQ